MQFNQPMLSEKITTHLVKLKQKKYREEFGEFVVEGLKGVEEALHYGEVVLILIEGNRRDEPEFVGMIKKAETKQVDVEFLGRKDIGPIKTTDTFPGVLAVCERMDVSPDDVINGKPIIFLDRIKDPGNLGTIIRTADWFGIQNIILSEESVDPYNEKVVRSSMGSMFRTKIFESGHGVNTLEALKKQGYTVVALTMSGKPLHTLRSGPKTVYVFGSESHGVSQEILNACQQQVTIEGKDSAESLNIAVSVGILLAQI